MAKTLTAFFILAAGLTVTPARALDLEQSFKLAQQGDPQLQAAEAQYLAAVEAVPQTRAALLPNISLDVFASTNDRETSNATGAPYSDGQVDTDTDGYTLTLSQTIYNHAFYKQLDQAKATVAQAGAGYTAEQQALIVRVAEAYFGVLASRDNLLFAQAEKEAIGQQLKQTQKRFDVGLIAITDVKESQASYDISIAAEISAQNQLENSLENLQVIIGQYPNDLQPLKESIPLATPEPNNIDAWTTTAKNQNLSTQAARYAVEAAAASVKLGKAGHYPNLNLLATHGTSGIDSTTSADVDDTTVSLNLNIPIYSGGGTTSAVRQANQQLNQAKAELDLQLRRTIQQTRSAFLGLKAAISRVKAFNQALISTQTAVEATRAGFDVGTRTAVEVLNALRNQYRSEADYAQARYDYVLNLLSLKQAAGTLEANDISTINAWIK